MSNQFAYQTKAIDEPPKPRNPEPERRRKRKRPNDVERPEPRTRPDKPSPEMPHDPQDVPEQELHAGI